MTDAEPMTLDQIRAYYINRRAYPYSPISEAPKAPEPEAPSATPKVVVIRPEATQTQQQTPAQQPQQAQTVPYQGSEILGGLSSLPFIGGILSPVINPINQAVADASAYLNNAFKTFVSPQELQTYESQPSFIEQIDTAATNFLSPIPYVNQISSGFENLSTSLFGSPSPSTAIRNDVMNSMYYNPAGLAVDTAIMYGAGKVAAFTYEAAEIKLAPRFPTFFKYAPTGMTAGWLGTGAVGVAVQPTPELRTHALVGETMGSIAFFAGAPSGARAARSFFKSGGPTVPSTPSSGERNMYKMMGKTIKTTSNKPTIPRYKMMEEGRVMDISKLVSNRGIQKPNLRKYSGTYKTTKRVVDWESGQFPSASKLEEIIVERPKMREIDVRGIKPETRESVKLEEIVTGKQKYRRPREFRPKYKEKIKSETKPEVASKIKPLVGVGFKQTPTQETPQKTKPIQLVTPKEQTDQKTKPLEVIKTKPFFNPTNDYKTKPGFPMFIPFGGVGLGGKGGRKAGKKNEWWVIHGSPKLPKLMTGGKKKSRGFKI